MEVEMEDGLRVIISSYTDKDEPDFMTSYTAENYLMYIKPIIERNIAGCVGDVMDIRLMIYPEVKV